MKSAKIEFERATAFACELVTEIKLILMDQPFQNREIDRGHVGSMNAVCESLKESLDTMRQLTGSRIKCGLCEATIANTEAAIEADWHPSYYIDDEEIADPICPHCAATKLVKDESGELVLKR